MIGRKPLERGVFEDIEVARRYDRETRTWTRYVSRSFVSAVKKWGVTGGRVLDVGTGTGRLAIEFARGIPGVEVIGLDLSDVALELARDNVRRSQVRLRVSFERGDAEDMPFEEDAFDLVISSNTLHLVKNPVRMFDEIHRVLKPEGTFFISDLRRSWLGILSGDVRAAYSPEEVGALLGQSKLHNGKVSDYFIWLSIWPGERAKAPFGRQG
jgi:ubiquinone/menaquinone biosynthesis C-methylase UbiE